MQFTCYSGLQGDDYLLVDEVQVFTQDGFSAGDQVEVMVAKTGRIIPPQKKRGMNG